MTENVVTLPSKINARFLYSVEYRKSLPVWQQMYDSYQQDIKRYAQRYLAPPPGLFQEDLVKNAEIALATRGLTIPVAEGSGWSEAAKAYALGGFEPDLVSRTLKGFSSLVGEHEPVIELPDNMEYLVNEATKDKLSLNRVYLNTVHSTLLSGRTPLYIDIFEEKPVIVKYRPESLIYWRRKDAGPDNSLFEYAVLREYVPNPDFSIFQGGHFKEFLEVLLELYLDPEDGTFRLRKHTETLSQGYITEDITPSYKGKTIDFIPLIAVGSIDNTPDVDVAPLLGISNCVVQIYSLGCMLNHAESKSAVPTMFMTGVEPNDAPSVTGASVLLTLPDYQSSVGYTKTDTSAMSHIQSRMEDFYAQAQELGASLLGSHKNGTESGEALRLRQASSTATLKSVVNNVGEGIKNILKMIGVWMNQNPEEILFKPNNEFSTFALTANETVALIQSWQSNAISHSTLLDNFRRAGMLQAGDSVEDEQERLEDPEEVYVEPCGCKEMGSNKSSSRKTELDIAENIQPIGMNKAI
ncbi:MAG: DUF4055 domain-containing protein [Melioribacteraceae bacterium]|nr:DUF4055 domain-containing protein [Melioribacteraceae bacterium]